MILYYVTSLSEINKKTFLTVLERLEQSQYEYELQKTDFYRKEWVRVLKIAICDDDQIFTGRLEQKILSEAKIIGVKADIFVYFDGNTLLSDNAANFDLIFLDIEMKHIDGIHAAKLIREKDKNVLIIYISNYEQYLIDLFEVEPFRFMSKPLNKLKFQMYFREACSRINDKDTFYQFTYNKEIRQVPLKKIIYFESRARLVHIFLIDGSVEKFYGKLSDVEKTLMNGNLSFLRIHQSFLVNYNYKNELF